ncbi:MAG: tRNA uridine-5-carboxymethylaminomethyl(34) synthesis GTPase MnmE [Pseudomonadota bacterium]
MRREDTIFSLATPPGRSGVAVVRLSGPRTRAAVAALVGGVPVARKATLRRIKNPATGETIDQGLVLWFPAPGSFTGDDVAEFHLHGGPAVIDAVLEALASQEGCRPAEAGEFTRRAFENGKLDLTEVEAADLIEAQTEGQRRQALRQMEGVFGQAVGRWRKVLVRALAYAEADLDFPDEDLPDGVAGQVREILGPLRGDIAEQLADDRRGEKLRRGYHVAILGAPNVGKSSLLNRLAQRPAAIVSDTAGTTRDVIDVQMDLGGLPVTLSDTAGLRESGDDIEAEGVRRALGVAEKADAILWVREAGGKAGDGERPPNGSVPVIIVENKCDLLPVDRGDVGNPRISALTGDGVNELLTMLTGLLSREAAPGDGQLITRLRHRQALEEVLSSLDRALGATEAELMAEDLRLAVRALGRLTGRVDVEDLLDVIFRDFCIGK